MTDCLPVNDLALVQVLQAQNDTGCVEDCPGLGEDVCVDVHHEVAASSVLHHEAHVALQGCIISLTELTVL